MIGRQALEPEWQSSRRAGFSDRGDVLAGPRPGRAWAISAVFPKSGTTT